MHCTGEPPPPREEHPGSDGNFTRRKLSAGGGSVGWGDLSPRTDQSRRLVRHEVGASPGISVGGYLGGFFRPLTMGDGNCLDPYHLPRGSPRGGVNLEDRCTYPKRERQNRQHQVGGGPLEDGDGDTESLP